MTKYWKKYPSCAFVQTQGTSYQVMIIHLNALYIHVRGSDISNSLGV